MYFKGNNVFQLFFGIHGFCNDYLSSESEDSDKLLKFVNKNTQALKCYALRMVFKTRVATLCHRGPCNYKYMYMDAKLIL